MAREWLLGTGLGFGVVAGVAVTAYEKLLRNPLPRTRGLSRLPGLGAAIDVVRDSWGVPHIRAASLVDAYAGQGFVHAQDRLWQLELNRRAATGRLAEIFGPEALPADRFLRRIGLAQAAEREAASLPADVSALLQAYARGVNAGAAAARALPPEFQVLRLTPAPWTVIDSLAYGKLLAWTLSANWETEVLRARLLRRTDPATAARLEPHYPATHPLAAEPNLAAVAEDLRDAYRALEPFLGMIDGGASNAWAVSGNRSATGRPLLASDPHLGHRMPPIWHEAHLTCPETDVIGASAVGLPGIIIGHNGHVAWGITAAPADVQDLYIERLNADDPSRYEWQGEWLPLTVREERIDVRGQREPEIEQVRSTRHGPILTANGSTSALALRWTSFEPDHLVQTLARVNTARCWGDVREALRGLHGPPLNIVCADADGAIAYQLAGSIPTRPRGAGLMPVPGWTGEHEWGPAVPFDELPSLVNPPSGVVVSANNQPVGPEYPHYLGNEWANGYRARRIADLLAERERLSMADMVRIQHDTVTLPGLQLQARIARLPVDGLSRPARQALDLLRAWDGEMRAESAGAAVYGRLLPTLLRQLFGPAMGDLSDEYLGVANHDFGAISYFHGRAVPLALELLEDPEVGGLPLAVQPRSGESRTDAVLRTALVATADDLCRLLGPNPAAWRWGALHQVGWEHPFGRVKALAPIFSRGPYELPGDADTINYAATLPLMPEGRSTHAWLPGYRLVADLGDPNRSVSLLIAGQWGLPGSRHYADQMGAWRSGRMHQLLYDRTAIDKAAVARLLLLPV